MRRLEAQLIHSLLAGGETDGVIGSQARDRLRRMPRAAYWAATLRYGIRTWETSVEGYLRRSRGVAALQRVEPEADDPGVLSDDRRSGVDPGLPPAPGRLRNLVAHAAVHALEPDLVILDEFQRFKALLDPDTDDAGLAQALFDQPTARVLMLSATPFKMYTLPDEPEGDDHYDDFLATVRFLAGDRGPVRPEAIAADLRTMRHAVFSDGADAVGRAARDRVQLGLRQLMTHTERVAASAEQDAMVPDVPAPGVTLAAADVRAFRSADAIARVVDRHDVFEYGRSAP